MGDFVGLYARVLVLYIPCPGLGFSVISDPGYRFAVCIVHIHPWVYALIMHMYACVVLTDVLIEGMAGGKPDLHPPPPHVPKMFFK
jgi:hypothetical protein